MQRTDREATWLEELGAKVQQRLRKEPHRGFLRVAEWMSLETDDDVDGWYYEIASIRKLKASFDLFIDNSLGPNRRAVYYGVGASSRKSVDTVDEACRRRWPRTQVLVGDGAAQRSRLRFTDPMLEQWHDEFYYGWYELEVPDTKRPPPDTLAERIVERLSAILSELSAPDAEGDPLTRLDELDGLRTTTVRLEQSLLRYLVLGKRDFANCALCGEMFPSDLLVVAHIKRRADCTDLERRDYKNNIMTACALGCDDLFERGYIVIEGGLVEAGPTKSTGAAVRRRVSELRGRPCLTWNAKSKKFFVWHRLNVSRRRDRNL
jgi:hypothetical protein